jgi:altronate hydrolase
VDKYLKLSAADNVAVAYAPLEKGGGIPGAALLQDIPQGHKFALSEIPEGGKAIKYGYPIGVATRPIQKGEWVHTHNLKTALTERGEYEYNPKLEPIRRTEPASFMGYLRRDGRVGARNEIWIIPTVGCVNEVCARIAERGAPIAARLGVDGVYAFAHPYGCSQLGEDHAATRKILAGLSRHPNAGGALIVGLGCENNTMDGFKAELGSWDPNRVMFMECQRESDEIASGLSLVEALAGFAAMAERRPQPASKLVVGLKCGGSDGLSGVTANAVAGAFCDKLVAMGGSAILTEVPEMFGAERILLDRACSREVFDKLVGMVNGFKGYFLSHGQSVYENPSPGNKAGGITTLEDKSLGCVQKGGHAPVADVLGYGDMASAPGLNVLYGPGNDLVSATALTAAGAQIILFTTGRGTPFGAPAVTLKISSNSQLAGAKANWIDFDAGAVAEGTPIEESAGKLFELVLSAAGGETRSKAERNGYRSIAIFKNGVTL